MVHKEQNILFPICAVNFTKEEWMGIYRDAKDYIVCFGVEDVHWQEAEDQEIVRENSGKQTRETFSPAIFFTFSTI